MTAQVAEVEEPAVPADEAAPVTGTSMTMTAEQPKSDLLDQGLKRAHLAKKAAERTQILVAGNFFSLYANLLSKDARFQWDKIVLSQVDTAPWTDVRGKEHSVT